MKQQGTVGAIRRIVLTFLLPTIAILIGVVLATASDPQSVAKRLEPSIVQVFVVGPNGARAGTGFVVSSSGHVVTNSHVTKPHTEAGWDIFVAVSGAAIDERQPAVLVKSLPGVDLAVLRVDGLSQPPVILSEAGIDQPAKGMTVFAIGFPEAGGRFGVIQEASFTTGTVNRLFTGAWLREGPEVRILQHSAPTNPGNSGGPIVNACGQVVGVNTQRELAIIVGPMGLPIMTDIIQGVFFASHGSVLIEQLKDLGIAYTGSNKVCRVIFGVASTNFPLMGGIAAVLVALLVIAVTVVRPRHIIQFLMRSHRISLRKMPETEAGWRLTGRTNAGRSVEILVAAADLNRSTRGIVIGSDPLCDRPILDPSVSYRHARLEAVDDSLVVTDMDSATGTTVDGSPILPSGGPAALAEGSQLGLGMVTLRVERMRGDR